MWYNLHNHQLRILRIFLHPGSPSESKVLLLEVCPCSYIPLVLPDPLRARWLPRHGEWEERKNIEPDQASCIKVFDGSGQNAEVVLTGVHGSHAYGGNSGLVNMNLFISITINVHSRRKNRPTSRFSYLPNIPS